MMRTEPGASWYLTGAYGSGKSHLLYAQYREFVHAGRIRCLIRPTRELVDELRRA
jgi:DNA replication protein DnaC